jgi:hypothetical protein
MSPFYSPVVSGFSTVLPEKFRFSDEIPEIRPKGSVSGHNP